MSEALLDDPVIDPEEMRDAARRLLTDQVDIRAAYAEPPRGQSVTLFEAMTELGWTQLTVPAAFDGLGQSFAALAPIYEEMGRVMAPVALFPSLASLELLGLPEAEAEAHELAVKVAAGVAVVAVAIARTDSLHVSNGSLTGALASIPADTQTTHLLLLVDAPAPVAWLLDLSSEGVTVTEPEMWDRSRRVIDISLDGARATSVLKSNVDNAFDRVRAHVDLALAWDSLGGARRSIEETVAYMLTRQQFGRPIGSFQALKHRVADHKVAIEIAAALARHATETFASGRRGAGLLAGQARLIAGEAYHAMTTDSVQLHGGIGFTWEHDCHLFLKRAFLNELLYETPDERRDRLAPGLIQNARADRT